MFILWTSRNFPKDVLPAKLWNMKDLCSTGDFSRSVVMPQKQVWATESHGGEQKRAIEHGQRTCPRVSPRARWQRRWRSGGNPETLRAGLPGGKPCQRRCIKGPLCQVQDSQRWRQAQRSWNWGTVTPVAKNRQPVRITDPPQNFIYSESALGSWSDFI